MIRYEWVENEESYQAAFRIRYEVFHQEQNVDLIYTKDSDDIAFKADEQGFFETNTLVLYRDDVPLGTVRISKKDYKLSRMAVLKPFRK